MLAAIVVALSFATADDVLAGAITATRHIARFSGLVFAVALVARAGRPHWVASYRAELTLAFVAAHGVHYATVIARAAVEPGNALRHPNLEALGIVTGGFGLLLVLALTARARAPAAAHLHAFAFYVAFGLLALALGSGARRSRWSMIAEVLLIAAFLWRIAAPHLHFTSGAIAEKSHPDKSRSS